MKRYHHRIPVLIEAKDIDVWLDGSLGPTGKPAMVVWRKSLFATMHLNANLPAAYFGVSAAQVVEVGLEVEI